MSAIKPEAKRVLNRSSKVGISLGGRSDERIICLLESFNSLNVWKSSCWVLSLPAMN